MYLKPNLPKLKKSHHPPTSPDSQYQPPKASSRKKVIMPISSEAEILAALASHKHTPSVTTAQATSRPPTNSQAIKVAVDPHHVLNPANERTHLAPGSAARINSKIKLILLSSRFDGKNRRLKQILAFLAQVLLWAAAYYVIFL